MANIIKIRRSATKNVVPATTVSADYGEMLVNTYDRKVYVRDGSGVPVVVADRIINHDATRAYRTSDVVIQSAILWQCIADIAAHAFNAAEWLQLGAVGAAVLKVPASAASNKIDTTTIPAALGLHIFAPGNQTADLLRLEVNNVADGRVTNIDAFGFPGPRFGQIVHRVAQPSHGFAFIGQVLYRSSGVWALAEGNVPAHTPIAVVDQIIDANTFVIRYAGLISQLSTGAFATGVIAANTKYYLSDTVPGQLTTVPPAVQPTLVLVTTSTTTGVLNLIQAGAAGVPISGGTMTGNLTFASTKGIYFTDTTTRILQRGAAGPEIDFYVNSALAARVDAAGAVVPNGGQSIITMEKGDLRYIKKAGDTLTGMLSGSATAPTLAAHLTRKDYVDTQVAGRLTQAQGDGRYLIPVASAQLVITTNSAVNFVHNLGKTPFFVQLMLVCKTADANYLVGDLIYVDSVNLDQVSARANTISIADANTVTLRFSDSTTCFVAGNKTTGVATPLVNSRWRVIISVAG